MSESDPGLIDDRSLGEAPDIAKRSGRPSRRRLVIYVLLSVLALLSALIAFLFITVRPSLDTQARIQRAASAFPGNVRWATGVEKVDRFEVVVLDAAEITPRIGERFLGLFQPDRRADRVVVGVQILVIAPNPKLARSVVVWPKDPSLFERNIFSGGSNSTFHFGPSVLTRHWLVLEVPKSADEIPFVLSTKDGADRLVVGEFDIRRMGI